MATEDQVQQMLNMMQQQMKQLQTLQTENSQLRNAQNPNPNVGRPKTKAPDRPVVNTNTDEREWELFKDSWGRYKTMTGITDVNLIRMELRAACSPDVNKLLFEYIGSTKLDAASEAELLTHIKSVAVKGTHKEVHRINFFRMKQMDGETVTQYVARLRSQATLCQFKVACEGHNPAVFVNYADEMITHQLVSGLRNQQHQSRILSEAPTFLTLAQKVGRLQCLESTEESTDLMRLGTPSHSVAAKSSYKRGDFQSNGKKNRGYPCRGCGKTYHEGKSSARKDCPAFNKTCSNCGIKGHFRAVCQKGPIPSRSNPITEPEEITRNNIDTHEEDNTSFAFATQDFRLAPDKSKGR